VHAGDKQTVVATMSMVRLRVATVAAPSVSGSIEDIGPPRLKSGICTMSPQIKAASPFEATR